MTRRALGLGAVVLLLVGVVVWMGIPGETTRNIRDARALADLPQRALEPMLERPGGAPDLVVIQDGDAGWFEIDPQAVPEGLEIGFHGPRMIDIFGGGAHVSVYCGGSGRAGKIIWVVENGRIADDFAFCNPRRMDLGPVRPFATPVEMVTQQLTRAEVERLVQEVATDPSRAMIATPDDMSPFTHRVVITPPLTWYLPAQPPFQHEVEQGVEARILDHLGAAEVAIRARRETNPNLSYADLAVSGMAMRIDEDVVIVPGARGAPVEVWVSCDPDICARLDTLPYGDLFAGGRNLPGLDAAMRDSVVLPDGRSPVPEDWFPTLTDLRASDVQIADPVPITYQTRFITRP